jgi:hypothetical protein
MSEYSKPVVLVNEDMAEGVYAASGCYTVEANITQSPEVGRGTYVIHASARHAASHHSGIQTLTLTFNQVVTFVKCSASHDSVSGSGSASLVITYSYHNNGGDYIGLGDIEVIADAGLAIMGADLDCNQDCGDAGHVINK